MIHQGNGKSFHEWFVEFENNACRSAAFAEKVDNNLREKNIYYDDLIRGNILQLLAHQAGEKKWFYRLYEVVGKLGGQEQSAQIE